MGSEAKATLMKATEKGVLQHTTQQLKVEYMRGVGTLTPKVIIAVLTTEDNKPRSFRTDNVRTLKDIIQCLCKCLYRLESDLKTNR